jgi:hypothetical protein
MLPTDGKPKKRGLNVLLRQVTSRVDARGLLLVERQSIVSVALPDALLVIISAIGDEQIWQSADRCSSAARSQATRRFRR